MAKSEVKSSINKFVQKLKGIKHIEVIIAIIAVALMIIIYSGITTGKSLLKNTAANDNTSSEAVIQDTESRLRAVLSEIEGVGKTEVMITYKSTAEKITSNTKTTNSSTSTSSTGAVSTSTSTTETPIMVNSNGKNEPYILKEIMPEVTGVIIVAEGAGNPVTKLAIMRAVQTLLSVNASNIEIFSMK